jgi:hypothetical protein
MPRDARQIAAMDRRKRLGRLDRRTQRRERAGDPRLAEPQHAAG